LRYFGRSERNDRAESPAEPERSEPTAPPVRSEDEAVMGEWEKTFARRLGKLREAWTSEFQRVAEQEIKPAYHELESFLSANGFSVSMPQSSGDLWSFRFALGEDVYTLVSFRLRGTAEVDATTEIVLPGTSDRKSRKTTEDLKRVKLDWAENQFRRALEELVGVLESTVGEGVLQNA
jgi:hypothetical protein